MFAREKHPASNPLLILPVGTHVVVRRAVSTGAGVPVCPAGAVGEIVGAPADHAHAYRVRLAHGAEVSLRRQDISIRKHAQRDDLAQGAVLADYDLYGHVIYRCVVGSRAYGLSGERSDTDVRGVYLPPAELHWSLYGVPEQLESAATEECYWELGKFVGLALKANPNILECLYTPLAEPLTPVAAELVGIRAAFLSRMLYQTYNGYVMSQFKKLEQDWRTTGAPRWKHAMHLVRLLLQAASALRDGHVQVRVPAEHRERLLAIRAGLTPWSEVNAWRLSLHAELDAALAATRLPERPDYATANDFLVRARRSAVETWTDERNGRKEGLR